MSQREVGVLGYAAALGRTGRCSLETNGGFCVLDGFNQLGPAASLEMFGHFWIGRPGSFPLNLRRSHPMRPDSMNNAMTEAFCRSSTGVDLRP